MSNFATESRLLSLYDLPISTPETALTPLSWLAMSTVALPENSKLDLLWLALAVTSASAGVPVVNPDFIAGGLASVYLIKDWSPDTAPWLQAAITFVACPNAAVPSTTNLAGQVVTITAVGNYTVVVCNNTTNITYTATVCGALTVDADP